MVLSALNNGFDSLLKASDANQALIKQLEAKNAALETKLYDFRNSNLEVIKQKADVLQTEVSRIESELQAVKDTTNKVTETQVSGTFFERLSNIFK